MSALIATPLTSREQTAAPAGDLHDRIAFQRYEYKYAIRPELVDGIRDFIRPYCNMDEFAAREPEQFYTINSLYLDNGGYRTYWDKVEEVQNRFKLRVRTYGKNCDGPVKLEVKHRFNDVCLKTCVRVPGTSWPDLLATPAHGFRFDLGKAQRSAFDEFVYRTRTLGATPRLLVRYERQAFTSRIDRYVRVTFDRRIVHQPTRSYELRGDPARWRSNDDPVSMDESGSLVILELKFMTTAPVWLLDLVRTFGLMRRGFSKYCTGVSRAGNAVGDGRDLAMAIPTAGAWGQ